MKWNALGTKIIWCSTAERLQALQLTGEHIQIVTPPNLGRTQAGHQKHCSKAKPGDRFRCWGREKVHAQRLKQTSKTDGYHGGYRNAEEQGKLSQSFRGDFHPEYGNQMRFAIHQFLWKRMCYQPANLKMYLAFKHTRLSYYLNLLFLCLSFRLTPVYLGPERRWSPSISKLELNSQGSLAFKWWSRRLENLRQLLRIMSPPECTPCPIHRVKCIGRENLAAVQISPGSWRCNV